MPLFKRKNKDGQPTPKSTLTRTMTAQRALTQGNTEAMQEKQQYKAPVQMKMNKKGKVTRSGEINFKNAVKETNYPAKTSGRTTSQLTRIETPMLKRIKTRKTK